MTEFPLSQRKLSQICSNEFYNVVETLNAGLFPPIFTVFGDLVYIVLSYTSSNIISTVLTVHVKGCIVFSLFLFYVP